MTSFEKTRQHNTVDTLGEQIEDAATVVQELNNQTVPDSLFTSTDPRIRISIRTKMSLPNTAQKSISQTVPCRQLTRQL
jgi:hypothetical protein